MLYLYIHQDRRMIAGGLICLTIKIIMGRGLATTTTDTMDIQRE